MDDSEGKRRLLESKCMMNALVELVGGWDVGCGETRGSYYVSMLEEECSLGLEFW